MTIPFVLEPTPDSRSPAVCLVPLAATLLLAVMTTVFAPDTVIATHRIAEPIGASDAPVRVDAPIPAGPSELLVVSSRRAQWPTPPAPKASPTAVAPLTTAWNDTLDPLRFDTRLGQRAPLGEFGELPLAHRAQVDTVREMPVLIEPVPAPHTRPRNAGISADQFIVMIDPGHGGSDPGSVAFNGLEEKVLTRDIAERTRLFLSEIEDVTVLLTRKADEGLSRKHRVERIRDSGADLVLSLHFNHLPQTDVTLVESFYAADENVAESLAFRRARGTLDIAAMPSIDSSITEGSARLAGFVQRRVFGEVNHENPSATDAGVKRDTLYVLTRSFVPGALIELTCLSNPGEAERLTTEAYRTRLAAALADAVRDYRRSVADRPLGELDA